MRDTLQHRLETALNQGAPALHEMVRILDAEGLSQLEILDAYYRLWDKLHEEELETEEETVENEIEMIVGWCSPHLRFAFARPYTNDEHVKYMQQRTNRYKGKIEL